MLIRENLFRDSGQTLAIDTKTLKQGGVVGGSGVTFTRNVSTGGAGPVFTSVRGLEISDNVFEAGGATRGHNRIVFNRGGGLVNSDPTADVDARDNWWGCNVGPGPDAGCTGCGPEPDPLCDDVLNPSGEARFGSTPAGTHTPATVVLEPADVSADSAYAAGADDPDELRTTVDRQTVRIRVSRPPAPDVVPVIEPDDPALTPGQRVELAIAVINRGNAPALVIRACVRLDIKLQAEGPLCERLGRLRPGHAVYRRVAARAR